MSGQATASSAVGRWRFPASAIVTPISIVAFVATGSVSAPTMPISSEQGSVHDGGTASRTAPEHVAGGSYGRTLSAPSKSSARVVLLLAAPGVGAETEAGASESGQTLLGAESRGPDEICSHGCEPKGSNMDLSEHGTQNPPDSVYISPMKSMGSAQDGAEDNDLPYIYWIQASGVDVNATFGGASPFPWENEAAVPGAISPSAISGVVGPDGWLDKPVFKP